MTSDLSIRIVRAPADGPEWTPSGTYPSDGGAFQRAVAAFGARLLSKTARRRRMARKRRRGFA